MFKVYICELTYKVHIVLMHNSLQFGCFETIAIASQWH